MTTTAEPVDAYVPTDVEDGVWAACLISHYRTQAVHLVGLVRDMDADAIASWWRDSVDHPAALAIVLAAMVDDHRTDQDLLGWVPDPWEGHDDPAITLRDLARTWDDATLRRHHRAYRAGRQDRLTLVGHQEYDRRRAWRRRRST